MFKKEDQEAYAQIFLNKKSVIQNIFPLFIISLNSSLFHRSSPKLI